MIQSIKKYVEQDLRLRKLFLISKQIQFNSNLRPADKLNIGIKVYVSTFILFNAAILSFLALKNKNKIVFRAPFVCICYGTLAYKLQIQWLNRQFIRSCQNERSEVAYYFRKRLLAQFSNHRLLIGRCGIFQEQNKQFQELYVRT